MKKYRFILIIISLFCISCIRTKKPNIEDLHFFITFNKAAKADLVVISPRADSIYSIQESESSFDIYESSDTMYIDIQTLTTGKGRDQVNFLLDTCIHYICLQNETFSVNSIRR